MRNLKFETYATVTNENDIILDPFAGSGTETITIIHHITAHMETENLKTEVQFQLDNVVGWIETGNYEAALIKARYLVEALEKIISYVPACKDCEEIIYGRRTGYSDVEQNCKGCNGPCGRCE